MERNITHKARNIANEFKILSGDLTDVRKIEGTDIFSIRIMVDHNSTVLHNLIDNINYRYKLNIDSGTIFQVPFDIEVSDRKLIPIVLQHWKACQQYKEEEVLKGKYGSKYIVKVGLYCNHKPRNINKDVITNQILKQLPIDYTSLTIYRSLTWIVAGFESKTLIKEYMQKIREASFEEKIGVEQYRASVRKFSNQADIKQC